MIRSSIPRRSTLSRSTLDLMREIRVSTTNPSILFTSLPSSTHSAKLKAASNPRRSSSLNLRFFIYISPLILGIFFPFKQQNHWKNKIQFFLVMFLLNCTSIMVTVSTATLTSVYTELLGNCLYFCLCLMYIELPGNCLYFYSNYCLC